MRAQVLCSGALGRRSRLHHEAGEYWSVTLAFSAFSASSASSAVDWLSTGCAHRRARGRKGNSYLREQGTRTWGGGRSTLWRDAIEDAFIRHDVATSYYMPNVC